MSVESKLIVAGAYARLASCTSRDERVNATARLILAVFDDFYSQLCEYPYRAKRAFETRDPHLSIEISRERLGLYSRYIQDHGPRMLAAFADLAVDPEVWAAIDRDFLAMIVDRYEADIAFSFAHSLRRHIGDVLWRPVAYSFPPPSKERAFSRSAVHRRLRVAGPLTSELISTALRVPGFSIPFRNLTVDAERILARVRTVLAARADGADPVALDVVEAGFFRDRRAFVVGRLVFADEDIVPFVVALLNGPEGIYADALLHRRADIHDLFSSALANFHVTTRLYYQTCVFLFSLMPRRPLGHHYSTIGYNHVGKVAILNEIVTQLGNGLRFAKSPGAAGTVALGFTFEGCAYHLKVIRDQPTKSC